MGITLPQAELQAFCKRNPIQKMAFFGSVLRNDFRAESDVDILIELEPGVPVGFFKFVEMQDELSQIIGRTVDLNTPHSLSRHFRQKVLQSAQIIYERI